jgi:N-acetylneuraminic acid mutarotase
MILSHARAMKILHKLVWSGSIALGLLATAALLALAASSATWTATGSLNTARSQHTATLLTNGQVLVAGGVSATGAILQSAELYDPATGKWTVTGSMVSPRYAHAAVLLPNGEVLVAGGIIQVSSGTVTCTAAAELYNPSTGKWASTGSMTKARGNHGTAPLPNGQVLAAGGFCYNGSNFNEYDNSAELYSPVTGSWAATGNMNIGHAYVAATLLQKGQVLVAGGNATNSADGRVAELYSNGQWTATGSLNSLRGSDTASLTGNGDVLVFGGGPLAGAEFYNPASGGWTNTRNFGVAPPVGGQTETLLSTGMVLLAGGKDRYKSIQNGAHIYSSATNAWTAASPMINARMFHTATLLSNGTLLVAGGVNLNGTIASAEFYTP